MATTGCAGSAGAGKSAANRAFDAKGRVNFVMLTIDLKKSANDAARDAALNARMSVLYYRRKAAFWERWDLWSRCIAALAASGSLVQILKGAAWGGPTFAAILAGLAAVIAAIGPILRMSERARIASVLLVEYVQHHYAATRLIERAAASQTVVDAKDIEKVLTAYHQTEVREAKEAPAVDDKLLMKCYEAVLREQEVHEQQAQRAAA